MATITNANGGNWNAGGTWVGGVAPASGDTVVIDGSLGYPVVNVVSTCAALTVTGAAAKTGSWSLAANLTVSGTLTLNGNSATNRVIVQSNTVGTARTITSAAVSLANADFMDITGAGAASWTGTSLGDCGGNSGITFAPGADRFAVASGNGSATATWSASSGGAPGASVPLPQDNVYLNAASGAITVTIDMPRFCKNLVCTGYSGTLALGAYTGVARAVYGSLTLAAGMTLTGNEILNLAGRGSHLLTTNGIAIAADTFRIGSATGTYGLGSALTHTGTALCTATLGVFNTNDYAVTCKSININNFVAGTSNFGASTVTLTTAATVVDAYGTVNAGTSTFVVSDTSTATKTFTGRGKTYNNLVIQGGALNSVVITGANTFNNVQAAAGTLLTLPSATSTTVGSITAVGAPTFALRLPNVVGNYALVPDAAPLRITGDMEIVCRVSVNALSGITQGLVSRFDGPSGSGRAYAFRINTANNLEFLTSTDGSAVSTFASSPAASLVAGTTVWLKVTYTTNDGSGNRKAIFYSAADQATEPGSWTLIGSGPLAGTTATNAGTFPLVIGSDATASRSTGCTMYRTIVRSGIGGTTVFDADFTQKAWGADSFTESSSNAATVTINGDLAKAGDGRVLLNASTPGSAATISKASGVTNCDYLVVKDSVATGGATFNAGVRSVFTSNVTGWNLTGSISKSGRCDVPLAERGSGIKKVPLAGRCDVPVTGRASAAKTVPLAGRCIVPVVDRGAGSKKVPLGGRVVVPVFDGGGNPTKTVQLSGRLIIPILVDVSASQFGPACVTATIEAPCPGDLRTQGSATVIEATVRADGNLVDPAELTLRLRKPDGTTTTMTRASALRPSAGVYQWRVRLDQAGTWHASVTTGDVGTASTTLPPFYVLATT